MISWLMHKNTTPPKSDWFYVSTWTSVLWSARNKVWIVTGCSYIRRSMKLKNPQTSDFYYSCVLICRAFPPLPKFGRSPLHSGSKGRSRHDLTSSTSFRCWSIPAHFPQVFLSFPLHNQAEETESLVNHTHNFPANFITFYSNEFSYEKSYEFHLWVLVKRSPDLMFSSRILIPIFSLVPKAGNSALPLAVLLGHAGVAAEVIDAKAVEVFTPMILWLMHKNTTPPKSDWFYVSTWTSVLWGARNKVWIVTGCSYISRSMKLKNPQTSDF